MTEETWLILIKDYKPPVSDYGSRKWEIRTTMARRPTDEDLAHVASVSDLVGEIAIAKIEATYEVRRSIEVNETTKNPSFICSNCKETIEVLKIYTPCSKGDGRHRP